MDNGQMAGWIARMEHVEKARAQAREDRFLDDIFSDDDWLNRATTPVKSQPVTGLSTAVANWLASLGDKVGHKQELALDARLPKESRGGAR